MRRGPHVLAATAGALLASLLLAGCDEAEPEAEQPEEGTEAENADPAASCAAPGLWTLDIDRYGEEMRAHLSDSGLWITEFMISGGQTLEWSEVGFVTVDTDITMRADLELAPDLEGTMRQYHFGLSQGFWELDTEQGLLRARDWDDSDFTVTTTVEIDGEEVGVPMDIPVAGPGDIDLAVQCADGIMVTGVEAHPVTQRWLRFDDDAPVRGF